MDNLHSLSMEKVLCDELIALKKLVLLSKASEMKHDIAKIDTYIESSAKESVDTDLSMIIKKLTKLKGPSSNHRITAYAQLFNRMNDDIEKTIFTDDKGKVLILKSELRHHQEQSCNENINLANELMVKKQAYDILKAEKDEILRKYEELQEHALFNERELEKVRRDQQVVHQQLVELKMQGIDFKSEVNRRCLKLLHFIQSRWGFVPSGVQKQLLLLNILKPPGDPSYDEIRTKGYREVLLKPAPEVASALQDAARRASEAAHVESPSSPQLTSSLREALRALADAETVSAYLNESSPMAEKYLPLTSASGSAIAANVNATTSSTSQSNSRVNSCNTSAHSIVVPRMVPDIDDSSVSSRGSKASKEVSALDLLDTKPSLHYRNGAKSTEIGTKTLLAAVADDIRDEKNFPDSIGTLADAEKLVKELSPSKLAAPTNPSFSIDDMLLQYYESTKKFTNEVNAKVNSSVLSTKSEFASTGKARTISASPAPTRSAWRPSSSRPDYYNYPIRESAEKRVGSFEQRVRDACGLLTPKPKPESTVSAPTSAYRNKIISDHKDDVKVTKTKKLKKKTKKIKK